ncbi:spermine/spermidine synthase domain-containing protein [Helicobacter labacensis]|uniref:spermine/spermidine synthase domain-containing protein n=1 Tax=Helicobacter labacensis TaxID=2316079 RepID=UPI000EAFED88|nr:spermidine synthase [Helicobacter labacensis]
MAHQLEIVGTDCAQMGIVRNNTQEWMFFQSYPFIQSELLAHVGACVHPNPKRALITGGFDTQIAFELLKYEGLHVDFVQEDHAMLENLHAFLPQFAETKAHARFKLYDKILDLDLQPYDILISLSTPNAHQVDGLQRMLNPKGLMLLSVPNPLLEQEAFKGALTSLQGCAQILMPFNTPYAPTPQVYLFASKHYHPLADMLLQKIDMLDGLRYYNAEIHHAAFAQPQWLKGACARLLKN